VPLSRSRDYLSIGEVLETIRPEFPDVSISKIRFLENEGLIAPERTASGYRKFYDGDVARLRHILSLQRDQFLPLRVIRERLARADGDEPPAPAERPPPRPAPEAEPGSVEAEPEADVELTRAGLAEAAGLTAQQLASLEDFGILAARPDGGYGRDDLDAARAAAGLLGHGLEARHLRMFRHSAEREAAVVEQIVGPLLLRRDPAAREEASAAARSMVEQARRLRDALVRASLGDLL
jgi:DNA-binding transcriptional MerR regulator